MKVQIPMVILVLAALIGRSIMAYSVQGSAAEVGEAIPTFNSRQGSTDLCPPLDPAAGSPISVSTVSELQNAVSPPRQEIPSWSLAELTIWTGQGIGVIQPSLRQAKIVGWG